jgi:hypothetical protein
MRVKSQSEFKAGVMPLIIISIIFTYLDFVLFDITCSWQRVPVTEKSGRVHTSAVSVAVLPQADEVGIEHTIFIVFSPIRLFFICTISCIIQFAKLLSSENVG